MIGWLIGGFVALILVMTWTSAWLRSAWFFRAIVVGITLLGLLAVVSVLDAPEANRYLLLATFGFVYLLFLYVYGHLHIMGESISEMSHPDALRSHLAKKPRRTWFENFVAALPRLLLVYLLLAAFLRFVVLA